MSESASALFSIADAGEFRFARFYIVCEEVPLGTPESPLIVCGLSDTLLACPNVAVCLFWNFFVVWSSYNITYHPKAVYAYCGSSILLFFHIRKLCVLRQPYQIDGSDRTISLLGYDDL